MYFQSDDNKQARIMPKGKHAIDIRHMTWVCYSVAKVAVCARLITGTRRRDHITPVKRERCPDRHLSTWQMIAASCLTVPGALYGQLTSRLAWYDEHTAAMATELLQPLDLVYGTLYRSNCAIQISPTDCFDDSWKDTFLRTTDTVLCDFWYVSP